MVESVCTHCGDPVPRMADFCPRCNSFLGWREDGETADETLVLPVQASAGAGPQAATSSGQTTATAPPGDARLCAACGRENGLQRRFCRSCGAMLSGPDAGQAPPPPSRTSWWRRLLNALGDPRRAQERRARAAFRRALPVRYRLLRWGTPVVVLAAVVGLLTAAGRHPVAWGKDRWYDLRDRLVAVQGVTASSDPRRRLDPEWAVANAVDNNAATAWAQRWRAGRRVPKLCGTARAGVALVLKAPRVVRLRTVEVVPG